MNALWIPVGAAALIAAASVVALVWRRAVGLRHGEQLMDSDERYRNLLEQTQEAVAVGVGGRVAYANPACGEMFGYSETMVGRPISAFFAPGSRELVEEIVQRAGGEAVDTIYLGGGTPSRTSINNLARVMAAIRSHFQVDGSAEVSMEANPEDVSPDAPSRWRLV